MFEDFKELLSIFNAQKVKYLIVGGYAVSFYAQPARATKDIDLLVKPDAENAKAVYVALAKFQGAARRTHTRRLHCARQVFSHR